MTKNKSRFGLTSLKERFKKKPKYEEVVEIDLLDQKLDDNQKLF